jgi:hypothetical protein
MDRWTVVEGEQEFVIESIDPGGQFQLYSASGEPFVTSAAGLRDLRRKIGVAIGIAQSGDSGRGDDPGSRQSRGGEPDA